MGGEGDKLAGKAKETVGGVTGDKKMENEGKGQNIGGKAQGAAQAVGDKISGAAQGVKETVTGHK